MVFYAYAMVLSLNPAEAADLVQETYVRAIKQASLSPDSNVKSWLFKILRNIWLNQLRHERAAPKIAELDSDEDLADVSVAASEDPRGLFVRKIERERVRSATQQLPIEYREIIILREYEELLYSENCQCPAVPDGNGNVSSGASAVQTWRSAHRSKRAHASFRGGRCNCAEAIASGSDERGQRSL